MNYTVKDGDSFASIAQQYTIGGAGYGIALANINDFPVGTLLDDGSVVDVLNTPVIDLRDSLTIPDEWLKPAVKPQGASNLLMILIAAFLLLKH